MESWTLCTLCTLCDPCCRWGGACLEPCHATSHANAETPSLQISPLGPITATFLISSIDPPANTHLAVDMKGMCEAAGVVVASLPFRDTFKSSGRLVFHSCPHRFDRGSPRAGRPFPILVATLGAFAHTHTRNTIHTLLRSR